MSAQRNLPAYRGPHLTYAVARPFGLTGTNQPGISQYYQAHNLELI